jgi:hypothetical protein
MKAVTPDRTTPAGAPAHGFSDEPGAPALAGLLDHFECVVIMIELIGQLPDLAEDIRVWRPLRMLEPALAEGEPKTNDDSDGFDPVARHAFEAVVTGLDTLGLAAATLCENAQGRLTPDEVSACRDIGFAMDSLLQRARALVEAADNSRYADDRADLYLSLAQNWRP